MPSLTLLMPAYNAERFIYEAIDTLLKQTFTDFELWVIDDGSVDSTADIASSFRDARITVFRNSINQGRDALVNEWVQKINTPFFTVTDADDASHPQRLQKQMLLLQADATLMMCGTSYLTIDQAGYSFKKVLLPSLHSKIVQNLHRHAQFHGPTTIMRSELLVSLKPLYRTGFFGAEADADLCCRIVSRFKTANVAEPLYYYRVVPGSMSRKKLTPASLNTYPIIFWIHQQRALGQMDCIEAGNHELLAHYIGTIESAYTPAKLHRHIAFYHLYWGLVQLAVKHAWRAITVHRPTVKNILVLMYIIFKSGLFWLNRIVYKKHYTRYFYSRS
jgi:glycosyltransferase involved in cell wall biosynthesis